MHSQYEIVLKRYGATMAVMIHFAGYGGKWVEVGSRINCLGKKDIKSIILIGCNHYKEDLQLEKAEKNTNKI